MKTCNSQSPERFNDKIPDSQSTKGTGDTSSQTTVQENKENSTQVHGADSGAAFVGT